MYPEGVPIELPVSVLALSEADLIAVARARGLVTYELSDASIATVIRLAASSGRSFDETINAMIAAADRESVA